VDPEQERELRTWAAALSEADAADCKAMGRAILMLLGQIESLRAELERSPAERTPGPEESGPAVDPTSELPAEAIAVYHSSTGGLRGRLRATVLRSQD
jgi:hypothetical protein